MWCILAVDSFDGSSSLLMIFSLIMNCKQCMKFSVVIGPGKISWLSCLQNCSKKCVLWAVFLIILYCYFTLPIITCSVEICCYLLCKA